MIGLINFINFTLKARYVKRWVIGGIILSIPVVNFYSLGYLSKTSRILMLGDLGLPTWERKNEIWMDGLRLLIIFILYEAIPFFIFSSGFFLTTLGGIPAFFGRLMIKLFYIALPIFTFFIPFAFAKLSEEMDIKKALEFEMIYNGIKEVFMPYLVGYILTFILLYLCTIIIDIPYLIGLITSSVFAYYVLLLATYYFTKLYNRTSLPLTRIAIDLGRREG